MRHRLPSARALPVLALLGLTTLLGGCLRPHGPPQALFDDFSAGRAIARQQCQACHQVQGPAPDGGAPTFTEVAARYRQARLDWELETISQVGHYRMPRKALTAAQIKALTAYIQSLDSDPADAAHVGRRNDQP